MWNLLGLGFMMENPEQRRKRQQAERDRKEQLAAVQWSPTMRWQKELKVSAASYTDWLREALLVPELEAGDVVNPPRVEIPGTPFYYAHVVLPRLQPLKTVLGNKRGTVFFDGDVVIPVIREPLRYDRDRVWMSLTPMEVFSLRPGLRFARGHTIVAGLGMGHQLIDVSHKRSVTKVTLVEKSRGLVDWVLPRIWDRLGPVQVEVAIGDAHVLLRKLRADAALIDIFDSYGGNWLRTGDGIEAEWFWGAAELGEE